MKTIIKKSDSELQSRSAQLGKDGKRETRLPKIDFRRRHFNRQLPTPRLLQLLQNEAPRFWELAQVVGKWVWIQFDGSQPHTITAALSELGFHWNKRRQLWQHPCGVFAAGSRRDPRKSYRCYFPADANAA